MHTLTIEKQALKFASAHMTIFPDGTKEPLHGHHYQVRVDLVLNQSDFKNILSFGDVKKEIARVCLHLDEMTLIATQNPLTVIQESAQEIEVHVCKQRYVFPRADVRLLPIDNVTTEGLSEWFCKQIQWDQWRQIQSVKVWIFESPGQGASFDWRRI